MAENPQSQIDRFQRALAALQAQGEPVAVIGHLRPDGDCIGSQVALCRVLRALGCDAVAVNGHRVPVTLKPFLGDTPFFEGDLPDDQRVAVTVDCADLSRVGAAVSARYPKVWMNIDHHVSNAMFAQHNLVDPHSCATAEMLTRFFDALGVPVDAVTAQALYVGIATDTGQFRYEGTGAAVFRLCASLAERGANPSAAARSLYEQQSVAAVQLLQRFLASLQFHCDGRVCIGILGKDDWSETGAVKEDTEGLVDYARSIAGVEIGVLLEDRADGSKGSFRAKDPSHRVDRLASRLKGGGHPCAAGFNPGVPLAEYYPRLLALLQEHFMARDGCGQTESFLNP